MNFEQTINALYVITVLQKHQVDFVFLTGIKINLTKMGVPITKEDLKLWVKPDDLNKKKLLIAVKEAGFSQSFYDKLLAADMSDDDGLYFERFEEQQFSFSVTFQEMGFDYDEVVKTATIEKQFGINIRCVNEVRLMMKKAGL